jgi:hypothetical protein
MLHAFTSLGMPSFTGTNLKFQNHPALDAEAVFLLKDRKTLGFVLPRLAIQPAGRNATFTMICQGVMLKTTFDLRTMHYRGKLAL